MIFTKRINTIPEFLEATIVGKLNLQEQVDFLRYTSMPNADELAKIVKLIAGEQRLKPNLPEAIDICGTGGSRLPRINTSTVAAFILATLGVKIGKHGNRASSGRCGSFDLLEGLGIDFEKDLTAIESDFRDYKLAFLYAPQFHGVMKHFGPARKKLGEATFFNLLGPLLSPFYAKRQIIGTGFGEQMELIAETCQKLGKERVFVVSGSDGLDEVTITGETFVVEARPNVLRGFTVKPSDFGIKPASFDEIAGGDLETNQKIALAIISGKCQTRHQDLVLANVAMALKLAGKVDDLKKGFELGLAALESGQVYQKFLAYKNQLPQILQKILQHKQEEAKRLVNPRNLKPSMRDFRAAITRSGLGLIAEIKQFSPSNPQICNYDFQPAKLARLYENCDVAAISVLTDQDFFGGSFDFLAAAAEATRKTPLLCKDFIIDQRQVWIARSHGADAILLIASILDQDQLRKLFAEAKKLKMDVVFEVHTESELEKVLAIGANIIGINNRDLHSFKVDLDVTKRLSKLIPEDKIIVSESGLQNRVDVETLPANVQAILVGTSLMASQSIPVQIDELLGRNGKRLKICGIRSVLDAKACENVDLIGLNFVPDSKRYVTPAQAATLIEELGLAKTVGVFCDQDLDVVNKIAEKLNLDFVQLHGSETVTYVRDVCRPVIKLVTPGNYEAYQPYVAYMLFDGPNPGSGAEMESDLSNVTVPYLLAGGINPQNAAAVLKREFVIGLDVATGSENVEGKDPEKIRQLSKMLTPIKCN